MNFDSRDRLNTRADLHNMAQIGRSVFLLIPAFNVADYDSATYGAYNPTAGTGLGRYVTSWTTYEIMVRMQSIDHDTKLFGRVPAAAEIGDTVFYIGLEWEEILRAAAFVPEAYLLVDNEAFRPFDIETNGVVKVEEMQVVGRKFTPPFRAAGY